LANNINSKPKVILMHGDNDQVVSINYLLEAKDFFKKNNYQIETKIFKDCEHRIPTEGSSLGLEFIKRNLYEL
jgi:phospholipase/carboxylesterase